MNECSISSSELFIVDNRISAMECDLLEKIITNRTGCCFIFKITDPFYETAKWTHWYYSLLKRVARKRNVAYLSNYQPAEWVLELSRYAGSDRIHVLPYPYIKEKEMNTPRMSGRKDQIILTGPVDGAFYPLRNRLLNAYRYQPWIRRLIEVLRHPGYADIGKIWGHDVIGEKYINFLSRYVWMFLCPSRAKLEFLKYTECAYAGCAPIGQMPNGLPENAKRAFTELRMNLGWSLKLLFDSHNEGAQEKASLYRNAMRESRDPRILNSEFNHWIGSIFKS